MVLSRHIGNFVDGAALGALKASGAIWFLAALAGQWAFFYYIAAFYGTSTLSGELEVWNRLQALGRTPYVAGDTWGTQPTPLTHWEPGSSPSAGRCS